MLSTVATRRRACRRWGARVPKARHAPLNSSIRAMSERISGVMAGDNGIGRLGFHLQHQAPDVTPAPPRPLSRSELLNTDFSPAVFDDLVQSYLS